MRIYLIRFFILFLITSFTISVVVGCGGRQRRQTRRLERRVSSLEKNWGTTEKRVVERVDSMEKRVTEQLGAMDKKMDDLKKEMDDLEKEQ
jgi:phage-related minor tail protein